MKNLKTYKTMNIEILEKGARLYKEIEDLYEHKEDLNEVLKRNEVRFEIQNGYNSHFKFRNELMPKYFKKVFKGYMAKLDERIKSKEEELKNL